MEKNNQFPNLPSNYVTLSQLQERWLTEKQQRNLKEKEKEKEKEREQEAENQQLLQQKVQNGDAQPKIEAAKPVEASKDRRSDNRRYRGRNRNFQGSSRGAPKEALVGEAAVLEGNKSEITANDRKSNDSRDDRIKQKKRNRKNKKQEQKEKMAKDGETETQREKAVDREAPEPPPVSEKMSKMAKVDETETHREKAVVPAVSEKMSEMAKVGETETHREKAVVREKPEPPATVEKKRVPVKRYAIKRDLRTENAGLVEKSVNTVEMEGEVKNVRDKSKGTIEIEKSIGDLSLNEESDRSKMQNNTYKRRNMEYRTRSRIVDSSYRKHRVRAVNRSDSEYKGVNGGFNRRSAGFRNGGYRDNGRYRGSDRNWKDRDSRNETVWVKKEVIVGTDNA